ncbi:MAG: hypothetical protein HQK51_12185, partial [Oligoflexia bacterium]|nr:hypothetical protein [Oligoflexia bacterium]
MSFRILVILAMFVLTASIQSNANAFTDNNLATIKSIGTTGYSLRGEKSILGSVIIEKTLSTAGYYYESQRACEGNSFYFPAETEKGKVLMSLLMAAKLSNKTLTQVTFSRSTESISG